jgi:hypothetical protein
MFKHILMQAFMLCVMAVMISSQATHAREPAALRAKTNGGNTSVTNKQSWYGILRAGYSIASKNSFHPVSKGSFAVSGGVYVRTWEVLSLGVDFGYLRWQNEIEFDPNWPYRTYPYALWNVAAGASLHASSLFRLRQIDPCLMFTLGLYGRSLENGKNKSQLGPGFSYGAGIRYMPDKLRFETRTRLGLGLIVRRHTMLLDDYGAWFAGPSHYWTKTLEVAAEIIVSW